MEDVFSRAAKTMACDVVRNAATASGTIGVLNAWNGGAVWGPLLASGVGYLAYQAGCAEQDWNPDDVLPDLGDGCWQLNQGGGGKIMFTPCENTTDPWVYCAAAGDTNVNRIISVNASTVENNPNIGYTIRYVLTTGEQKEVYRVQPPGTTFYIEPVGDATCEGGGQKPPPPSIDVPPKDYTDSETGCELTVNFEGFVQLTPDGRVFPVYQIESKDGATTRADGGRVGGCNFAPHIYVDTGGPDGPNPPVPPIPVPPSPPGPGDDGVPWWLPPLVGSVTSALLNQLGRMANDTFNYKMNPGAFEFIAPCDKTEDGSPQNRTWTWGEEPLITRLHTHQVAMMEMLQQHLDWKTPTCGNEKPELEGEWRTISFRSDETSPYGKSRLRKRFRYRSTSGWGFDALVNHWKDFTWEAGPVCVIHAGSSWGTPQVWAASADEGKRVIRHAAGEAGIDADQDGRWVISGSSSARVGVSGTMRVDTRNGVWWITARDGSEGLPMVAKPSYPYGLGVDITEAG